MIALLILIPILAAAGIMLGAPVRKTANGAAWLNLLLTLAAIASYNFGQAGYQEIVRLPILPDWGLQFLLGVDGLSLVMLLLTAIVTVAAIWVAPVVQGNEKAYFASLLFISAGATGAFASLDLFFFYAFHEMALIPTFLLIGIWGTGDRQAAAWKITIYLAVGSFILLLGLLGLYLAFPADHRTFDIPVLQQQAALIRHAPHADCIYLALLFGFGILISLFPFHTWAPTAYASAPTPAAMLHSGVLKKFGLYGLLRVALPLLPAAAHHYTGLLLVLLVGNIIYCGLATIGQKRLDLMLGYSSVMHMGYIFLGIASFNILGTTGAALLMFAHGLSIAALFAIAGQVRERTGTLNFSELGGLAKPMPVLGLTFGLAAFASIGLPGFANFASEILVFFGAFSNGTAAPYSHTQIATTFALWGMVISAVYMLRGYKAVFMGEIQERWAGLKDVTTLRWPLILLLAVLMLAGIRPQIFVNMVKPVVTEIRRHQMMTLATFSPVFLEITVLFTGVFLLIYESFANDREKDFVAVMGIACLSTIFIASFWAEPIHSYSGPGLASQFYTADAQALYFKRFALLTTIIVLIISMEYRDTLRKYIYGSHPDAGLGEFYTLPVFTCAGLMWMASAVDFVMIFVSLELVTISFYILVAYMRRNTLSLEAGVKYLVLGALSTGFFVYGVTWIFGLTGTTNLALAAEAMRHLNGGQAPMLFGFMLILMGLGFKVAAVPFQFWVPDVYQGAPTPVTAFLSVGSKAAGFIVLIRVVETFISVPVLHDKITALLSVIAALTLIYGNLAAMPQNNLKRLLAYSSIAHAGYLLIAIASLDTIRAGAAIGFYLAGYLLMTLLSFLVIVIVANATGGDDIANFNGLGKRSPALAFALLVSMLSLAGVPLTGIGFFGKFFILRRRPRGRPLRPRRHRHHDRRRRLLLLPSKVVRARYILESSSPRIPTPLRSRLRSSAHPLRPHRDDRPHHHLRPRPCPRPPHAQRPRRRHPRSGGELNSRH